MTKSLIVLGIVSFSISAVSVDIHCYRWKSIVPGVSTCENVKSSLKVAACDYPISRYSFEDARIKLVFSDVGDDENRIVEGVTIGLRKLIRLADYESDLTGYVSGDTDVNGVKTLTNPKKGIQLVVSSDGTDDLITTIYLNRPEKTDR